MARAWSSVSGCRPARWESATNSCGETVPSRWRWSSALGSAWMNSRLATGYFTAKDTKDAKDTARGSCRELPAGNWALRTVLVRERLHLPTLVDLGVLEDLE